MSKTRARRYSLAKRMRLTLSCMVILLLLSFLFSIFYIMRKERREAVIHESSSFLSGLSDAICSDVARYKEISRLIMVDDELVDYLRTDTDPVDAGLVNTARNSVLEILNVTSMVDSVFVFRNDGQYLATNRGKYMFDHNRMDKEEWEYNILEKKGGAVISVNADNALFKLNNIPFVTIGRAVYDIRSQKKLGIMLMNISNSFLDQKLFNLSEENILIMGTDGTYLSGDQNIASFTDISRYYDASVFDSANGNSAGINNSGTYENAGMSKEEKDYYTVLNRNYSNSGNQNITILHDEISNNGIKYLVSACLIPDMPIVAISLLRIDNGLYMYETVYVLLLLMVLFLVVLLFMGAFINKNLTSPILELTRAMEKNKASGKLDRIENDIPPNEIGVLKDSYNGMVDRVNNLFANLIDKEKQIQKAEMRVLHEQIKPHFLYNSLETIGFMAMDAGADNVHSAVETLGSFYRNFLSKGDREIPFEREVTIARDYLSLQKLRYGDIIDDEYDIADDTNKCIVPKLILQPLVENSIYHGIRLKGEKGTIKISSRLEGDDLHITVTDTGVGISQEKIDEVLSNDFSDRNPEIGESFGLWGTIERIRYYCDREDVVHITAEPGEYTEIELIIPQNKKNRG